MNHGAYNRVKLLASTYIIINHNQLYSAAYEKKMKNSDDDNDNKFYDEKVDKTNSGA